MERESLFNINFPKEKIGKVRSWTEMCNYLPDEISEHNLKFLNGYFRAQLKLASGQKVRAVELINRLDKVCGFNEFEDNNEFLFTTIDLAVRGQSNRLEEPRI